MAQFDLYRNPSPTSSRRSPYIVEVQGNFCDLISTCVVIPLVVPGSFIPAPVLNPKIVVDGIEYVLCTAEITSVSRLKLGRPVGSVAEYRVDIIQAIDRLLL